MSYKLVSKEYKPEPTIIKVGNIEIGSNSFVIMAGPCSIESREQLMATAESVAKSGAHILRGGAYKQSYGLPIITEVLSEHDIQTVAEYTDILQVGARNMQNFALLKGLGKVKKPVLLKRGLSATIHEWLMSAEYLAAHGNMEIILCERGIRTFETATRNTCDITAIPLIHELSHLPVILDPSHATGKKSLITPLSKAGVAIGADGLMIEVHPNPEEALSDGPQSLTLEQFSETVADIQPYINLRQNPAIRTEL